MSHLLTTDPFVDILSTTDTHRARHGCGAYPYDKGTLLGVLAAAVQATRIIEVGTALGYSALWLAYGAPSAQVDTIESDPEHVQIARQHCMAYKMSDRVHVHHGDALTVLDSLDTNVYDLAFFDGFAPTPPAGHWSASTAADGRCFCVCKPDARQAQCERSALRSRGMDDTFIR